MKPFLIKFWHGNPSDSIKAKILRICRQSEGDTNLYFDHTLNDFCKEWKDKFLFFPPSDRESPYIDGTIYVTQHSSFGQR